MVSVLQVMSGSPVGGAEAFFERLVTSLPAERVTQVAVVRSNKARQERLAAAGVSSIGLPFRGSWDLLTRMAIRRLVRANHPNVVLAWMNRAAKLSPRHVAGEDYALVGRLGGYYNLKYYAHCDHLVANTHGIRDYLLHQGWPADRAHYIPNFAQRFEGGAASRVDLGVASDGPLVLSAGRLHRNKAFDTLIDALCDLPEAHLCIAGTGPLESELKKQAEDRGVASRVSWLGWVPDMGPLYRAADVYVCPSRHEPLGCLSRQGPVRPIVLARCGCAAVRRVS